MDANSSQDYSMATGKNGAMPADLKSKEGTNRDGTRGASTNVIDQGQKKREQAAYTFFGSSDGSNDGGNKPEDRGHATPSLNAPPYSSITPGKASSY